MAALLTYRSRDSFESRFGRKVPATTGSQKYDSPAHEHWDVHNDGHKTAKSGFRSAAATPAVDQAGPDGKAGDYVSAKLSKPATEETPGSPSSQTNGAGTPKKASHYFSAQSYLRYQGSKFVARYDSNCYIAITRKLDTHDISRLRCPAELANSPEGIAHTLSTIAQPALVLGIESDGLFTFAEQQELAAHIPNARLERIESPEGHDAFLLQFEQVNRHILGFLKEVLPDIMAAEPVDPDAARKEQEGKKGEIKESTFGEAEVEDLITW
jgi:homoserine O-acetyltransferase